MKNIILLFTSIFIANTFIYSTLFGCNDQINILQQKNEMAAYTMTDKGYLLDDSNIKILNIKDYKTEKYYTTSTCPDSLVIKATITLVFDECKEQYMKVVKTIHLKNNESKYRVYASRIKGC